ncbi:MAG TPA: tripartite tricarboxylate transporter substrate binding protein [Ramlibacter sp.]|jgi:tripartite-type tricarboxylate transporter receptor subunit TctC|nr:tripartite tricarboxylate transporter substrate binding protein [Ramlibacter sp.]
MQSFTSRRALLAAAAVSMLAAFTAPAAFAQAFPAKPIRMIVPFPAGGTTDIVARLVAQRMSESMGQPVLVENRAGAGGAIGADVVAKAPPDGYTILMHNLTFPLSSVAQTLAKRSPFDAEKDFAGISIAVYVPFVLTTAPSVPVKDLRDLAALLRAKPELQYNYGSTGPGSTMHVLGEAFKREAKVNMEHIAFKGAAPLKQELLAGRLQVGGDQLSSSLAEIRAGTLKAIATSGSRRTPVLPDVPTVRELGFASMELEGWNGLFAPAGTPRPVIERLHREVVAAVKHPDVAKRLVELGAEPVGSSPAEQEAILRRQMDQFRSIIRDMKLE